MLLRGPEVYKPMNSLQWDINITYKVCSLFLVENLDVFEFGSVKRKSIVLTHFIWRWLYFSNVCKWNLYTLNWLEGITDLQRGQQMRIIEIPLKGNFMDPCLRSASFPKNCLHLEMMGPGRNSLKKWPGEFSEIKWESSQMNNLWLNLILNSHFLKKHTSNLPGMSHSSGVANLSLCWHDRAFASPVHFFKLNFIQSFSWISA